MREFGHFLVKWANVFMWVGIGILIYAIFATANPDSPGGGVLGSILGGIGQFILAMLTNIILPVIDFIGDTIRNVPRPFG